MLGHVLDGSGANNGYSEDYAYCAFLEGMSIDDYVLSVKAAMADARAL